MIALLPFLLACGQTGFYFDDSVETQLLNLDHSDDLKSPYVIGSTFTIRAAGGPERHDWTGWSLALAEADGASVFELQDSWHDESALHATAYAAAEGSVTLQLLDEQGEVVREIEVEVARPDRIELHDAGPGAVDAPSLDDVDAASRQVLVDGVATFELRYYQGERRLYGNGAYAATPSADLTIEQDSSSLWSDQDWLRLRPDTAGPHEVSIEVGGEEIAVAQFEGVEASVIADLSLHMESTADAEEGSPLDVLAWATDADGQQVHGVEVEWSFDGDLYGSGDLFNYSYDALSSVTLGAALGEQAAEIEIRASDGVVGTSQSVGCSASGGAAGGLAALLAALGAGRRRRR